MEYYFPKRIYFNYTLVIIAATSLLPEGVPLGTLDRYAGLPELSQCNLPLPGVCIDRWILRGLRRLQCPPGLMTEPNDAYTAQMVHP